MPILTNKEAIAAFYLKLARNQPYTNEELRAAEWRLRIPRLKFMKNYNLIEDQQVPEPSSFLGEYMVEGWFPRNRETLEGLSAGYLLGRMDMEFRKRLGKWWDEEHGTEKVAYRKDKKGKVIMNYYPEADKEGNFAPDYRTPETEVARIAVRREVKADRLYKFMQKVNNPGLTSGAFNPMQASLVLSLLFLGTSHISLASVRPNLHVLILSSLIEDLGTLFIYGLTSAGLRRYD